MLMFEGMKTIMSAGVGVMLSYFVIANCSIIEYEKLQQLKLENIVRI